jgi:hypothetical protein
MTKTSVEPEKLWTELHQKIDAMNPEQLELLRRVMLKLELENVIEQLHEEFDSARDVGKLDKADAIIRQVRAKRPYA